MLPEAYFPGLRTARCRMCMTVEMNKAREAEASVENIVESATAGECRRGRKVGKEGTVILSIVSNLIM